ncbi:MAG TPA: prepilin-type N-terminal cleavage/methylation domain-containing protein [Candidatus Ozemobacteraceae bacterium]|nr:prepilin-type N-terminal cleavage/methylation domain-containing protein [Candidatus Ozemobacteraceae bacterium]
MHRGVTLLEMMIVTVIGVMLLIPTIDFMVISRKSAYQGLDRLDTLASARLVIEQIQRDVKALCFNDSYGYSVAKSPQKTVWQFPVFPVMDLASRPSGGENYANWVRYVYEPEKRTIIRQEIRHPQLHAAEAQVSRVLATNVGAFSLERKAMFGLDAFDVEITCVPLHPARQNARTRLRTAIRSEFLSRLERNARLISNRRSLVDIAPL